MPFVLFFEGLARATSPQAAFLHKTLVLWVAILAVVFLGERLQWGHWLAIGLLVVGQVGLLGGLPDSDRGRPEAMILARRSCGRSRWWWPSGCSAAMSSWTVGLARMGLGSVVLVGWVARPG